MKKVLSVVLVVVMLVSILPTNLFNITASATQSRSYNFSTAYSLTGNYRDDIVAVAKAQYLKTESQLGYTEGWCADFVCDCAKLAKIPNFPVTGGVEDLKSKLISWGGIWHSRSSSYTPKKGDIVFLNKSKYYSSGTSGHVGIVTENGFDSSGRVRTIEGNTSYNNVGDYVNTKNRKPMPNSNDGTSTMYVVGYIEMKLSGTTPTPTPSTTEIISCKWYVTIPANYKLLLYNNYGADANSYNHYISAKSSSYRVSCDRKVVFSNGNIEYRFTTGDGYIVYFKYNSSMSVVQNHSYSNACDTTCNVCGATRSITHNYQTYYESAHPHKAYKKCTVCGTWSYTGATTTSSQCSTCNPKPGASTVSVSSNNLSAGHTITINWTKSSNTKHYNLKYHKDGVYYTIKSNLTDTKYDFTIPEEGVYYFYVDSVNDYGYTPSSNSQKVTVSRRGVRYDWSLKASLSEAEKKTIYVGDKVYFVFNLYDEVTRKPYNDFAKYPYTVDIRLEKNGKVLYENTLTNLDYYWFATTLCEEGSYNLYASVNCSVQWTLIAGCSSFLVKSKNTCATTGKHTYTNACDTSCNVCKAKRTIKHTYSNNCDTSCNVCKATRTITHVYKTTTTKATLTKNGSIVKKCTVCGKVASNTAIKYAKTFKLSTTAYTYNGGVKTPTVTVKDSAGKTLKKNTDYTVTYASGRKNAGTYKVAVKMIGKYSGTKTLTFKINPASLGSYKLSATSYTYDGKVKKPTVTVKNSSGTKLTASSYTVTYASGRKNVGTYKVTIKGKGNYTGTKTLTFKINPAKTTVSKLTAGKKSITVAITKKSTQVTGYQIHYSTSKTFSKATTKTISSYNTTKYTLKSLSAKKTYYVRVRTYKKVGGTTYYSGWSTYKYVKTK